MAGELSRRGIGELEPFRRLRELMSWDPFQEMLRVWPEEGRMGFQPTFDVVEGKDSYLFKADVPGVRDEDLDITLTGNRLTISGKREEERKEEGERYYAYERHHGSFTRTFTLPEGVDTEGIKSELKDGVLTLVLPKKPEVQPKRITVKGTATKGAKA